MDDDKPWGGEECGLGCTVNVCSNNTVKQPIACLMPSTELPNGVSPISESDYFLKNTEFRVWLKDEKDKVCPEHPLYPITHAELASPVL